MASAHIIVVNEDNFEAEVLKSDKLVLIDFYADWCGPCKALSRTLDIIADERKADVKIVKIDVDQSPELAAAFQIKALPTIVTMKDGEGLMGMVGNVPKKEIERLLQKSLEMAADKKNTPKGPKGPSLN